MTLFMLRHVRNCWRYYYYYYYYFGPATGKARLPTVDHLTDGSNTSVFQEALENVLTATIVLTSTLKVVLEVTAVI